MPFLLLVYEEAEHPARISYDKHNGTPSERLHGHAMN